MMIRTIFYLIVVLTPTVAAASVNISDTIRFQLLQDTSVVNPGKILTWNFDLNRGDSLEIRAELAANSVSGIGAYICPQLEYQKYSNGQRPQHCGGVQRGERSLSYTYRVPYSGRYVVFIDNSFSIFSSKSVSTQLTLQTRTPDDFRNAFTQGLSEIDNVLRTIFRMKPFDINVVACGEENAYSDTSTGDITLCSELLFQTFRSGNERAFLGIFFHELGHTLLNLWGLPNYRNEQTVDEFAAVMMVMAKQEPALEHYIAFFSGRDPVQEAVLAKYHNSPHPLSIQRMRNIGHIVDNQDDYVRRWIRILYQNMKSEILRKEIASPSKYSDIDFARSVLRQRGEL